jgi:hypothetical protein
MKTELDDVAHLQVAESVLSGNTSERAQILTPIVSILSTDGETGRQSPALLAVPALKPLWPPGPQEANTQPRVYDRDHKDYHDWDDRENQAWEAYQSDHHMKSHEFPTANKKEQSQ